jgi:hypothetical protein
MWLTLKEWGLRALHNPAARGELLLGATAPVPLSTARLQILARHAYGCYSKDVPMPLNRREFLHLTAEGVVVSDLLLPLKALAATQSQFKAVAFDAFPIFDPRSVFGLAETLFPGKGSELSNAWRTRQFEYQWLRAIAGR